MKPAIGLVQNSLAGEELSAEADHEAQHGQTAVPGLGECDKTEAGSGISHGWFSSMT